MEALISDIHGNIEALEAVLADIKRRGVDRIFCLGDVVGYGASPLECLDAVKSNAEFCLMGNHEWAMLNEPVGFSQMAAGAIRYQRKILKPGLFGGGQKKTLWKFIESMPQVHEEDRFKFVHGSPTNPLEEYILRSEIDEMLGEYTPKIAKAFDNTVWVSLFGHTHTAGIVTQNAKWIPPGIIHGRFRFDENMKYLVNIGSVGQPRDADWRASYVILNREESWMEYIRVEYDVDKAMNKILAIPELEDELGKRLRRGN